MKPTCYKDFLQQHINRSPCNTDLEKSEIARYENAKKIKRKDMLDTNVEILHF